MPLPDDQLRRLEEDLEGRERWLQTLRRTIEGLQDEASAHEMILTLGRNADVLGILSELCDRPELGERIAEDPRSFLEARGIRLPEDATVTATGDPRRPGIEARFVTPTLEYGVGWSQDDGFYIATSEEEVDAASD